MEYASQNKIKQVTKLKQKRYRKEQQQVIIEGKRLLEQVIANGIIPTEIFLLENSSYEFSGSNLFWLKQHQLNKLSSTQTPQNIFGVVPTIAPKIKAKRILLYLDAVSEPGNIGTIFRTAAAAGIDGIILSEDCCEIWNPKVIRASLGTVFSVPSEIHSHKWLFEQEAKIISSSLHHSNDLFSSKLPTENCIIAIGSEAFGVSEDIIAKTNETVHIPMTTKIESLNVAVAAGIIIFHYANQLGQTK